MSPFTLVLGGGAIKGAAHLGVLQVLEERGIRPDLVVGTSVGALVGAAYASGLPLPEFEAAILGAGWGSVGRLTAAPRLGILDPRVLDESVATVFAGSSDPLLIESLLVRFAAVATDVRSHRTVVLDRGPLPDALRASIAIPGLFPPVHSAGMLLADGGLSENLPLAAAHSLGADRIIAVRIRPEIPVAAGVRAARTNATLEDAPGTLVIRPAVKGMSQWTTRDVARLIEAGRTAAEAALDADGDMTREAAA